MHGHRSAIERFWEDTGPNPVAGSAPPPAPGPPSPPPGPAPAVTAPPPPPIAAPAAQAAPIAPPAPAPPLGPPPRTGAAVAALLCAMLTLVFPGLGLLLGFPVLAVLTNVPGLVFGLLALANRRDPEAVERNIARTWACNLGYLLLLALIALAVGALLAALTA
ncbi:hypothetical protein O4J56_03420 [Nocardiopsis sp. RSe5-2]|uniref:Uncharacterized protein n=1 Tax=Nocardiopsis endophytica TaxID=3018445 RepID=A0ABT4TZZ6_9ACTN|nr:hypothetical protein [Nocardiopsis endophytica]MDA2809682.1 hypothetical protein [Nocardiopsis endophytica]